jgi:Domain of unknown function (DUF1905)
MVTFSGRLHVGIGGSIEVPPDVVQALGSPRKRAPVRAEINGVEYRTTLAVYSGRTYLGIRRELREAMRIAHGDVVLVRLMLDTEPRR